jgi:cyclin L
MTPAIRHASHLINPLAARDQLETSGSQLDGVPPDLEKSAIYGAARLTQTAGILLRLPQNVVAQAIVICTRFWIGPDGGSLREHAAFVRKQL